jgi:isoquinoline 1-oxidoreductase beta subunit
VGTVESITGLPASAITVHPTLLGGGLGRKIEQDYVAQAVKVAKAIGKPVKLTWSREEDLSHDQYRPSALVRVRLGLDAGAGVSSYAVRVVTPSPLFQRGWIGATGNDNVDGAAGLPYAFANRLVEYVRDPAAVPVGFWRSVGESINCFAIESALDEAAVLAGVDPLAFRQQLLAARPRELAVLNAAAAMIGWGTAPAAGVARGLALGTGFGSIAAMAVEVSQPVAGTMKVNRVVCAVDCGVAVNPTQVESQIEGGIIQGISSALWGQTTFSSGKASSRNFSNTRVLKMKETPAIQVQIITSGLGNLGGIGEVGVPPVAPALANAWAKLTGTRMRTMPFFPGATMSEG